MSHPKQIPEADRWRLYELEKQAWQDRNPDASYEQYQAAMREIAKRCGV